MAIETNKRLLEGSRFWMYSAGILGQLLPSTLINAFAATYYIYVVGLDAFLVNLVTALGVLFNGISGPIFGAIIDNHRPGRFGKRKPFLLYGIPFLSIFMVLMWILPVLCDTTGCVNLAIASWFLFCMLLFYFGFALIRNAYLSSLPEQSQDDKNRVSVSALQGVFSILATVIGILLPNILYAFLVDPENPFHDTPDGQFLLGALPWIAIIFAAMSIIVILIAYKSMDESFHDERSGEPVKKASVVDVLKDIFKPFKDRENGKWILASFFMNTSMRMIIKQLTPIFTFVIGVRGLGFPIMITLLIPFAGIGFWYWQKRAKRGLKSAYTLSAYLIAIAFAAAFILYFIPDFTIRLVAAFAIVGMILFNLVTGYLLPNPIISKLVDIAPETMAGKAKDISGAYFGAFLFTLNIANVAGDIILGLLLAGDRAWDGFFIALVFPVSAVLFLASGLIFSKSKIE